MLPEEGRLAAQGLLHGEFCLARAVSPVTSRFSICKFISRVGFIHRMFVLSIPSCLKEKWGALNPEPVGCKSWGVTTSGVNKKLLKGS